ncbi:spore cortex biosynthesis protein YabQ [Paenibacillus sp. CAU 1782]
MTLEVQWLTVAFMLACGAGMGIVFDGYRVISSELRFPRWWLPLLDVAYWALAAVAVFRMLYASNNGEVRAYVFLGLALGAIIHYWLLSSLVIKLVKWFIDAVRAVISFLVKMVMLLIVKPVILLLKFLRMLLLFGSALTIFVLKIMLQLVRPFWIVAKWMFSPLVSRVYLWLKPYVEKLKESRFWKSTVSILSKKWKLWFGRDKR